MPVATGVRARLIFVVLVVPVPVGIAAVAKGEEASSAVAPTGEAVAEAPPGEAAGHEPRAWNARMDGAAAARSHGRPCLRTSQRQREERGKEKGGQATISIWEGGRHGLQ